MYKRRVGCGEAYIQTKLQRIVGNAWPFAVWPIEMKINTDEMLQSYGLDTPFPQQWKDSGFSSALATLGNESTSASDSGNALVDEMLSALTTSQAVATDEQDPLGSGLSIMELLRQRGNVPTTPASRGLCMPSSTSFDARKFLRDAYGMASIAELEQGLAHLKQSMAGNESGLRKMIDSDYESYVSSKRRLDEVMGQLANIGVTKDTGYGMAELETRLHESANQLTIRTRPLDGISAERQRLENALRGLESCKNLLELPQSLEKHFKLGEHDQFLRTYKRGAMMIRSMTDENSGPEEQKLGLQVAERAQKILTKYRSQIHDQLMKTPGNGAYAPLLAKLVDLGVSGNPALEWLEHNFKRSTIDIEEAFNLIKITAMRNLSESMDSDKKIELGSVLAYLSSPGASINDIAEKLDTNDDLLDTESAIYQWKQLLKQFEKLHHILKHSAVFYHEFVSLSQHPAISSGSIKLSQSEIGLITKQCQDLVVMTGNKLVECLTAPISDTHALPIASAHRSSGNFSGSRESEHLTWLPVNSNSIAVAHFLGRILEILSSTAAQISEFVPMNMANPLNNSMALVKQHFVKALCSCWTRDSMLLGSVQDWSTFSASKFPTYFVTYHGVIIEKLRYLLDSNRGGPTPADLVAQISKSFPAALALSIRSVESALSEASRATADNAQNVALEAQLQPASPSQDAKLLVTLNDLETLRKKSLEQIYDQYESVFKQQHHIKTVKAEVTPEVDKITAQLFDVYIRKKRSRLSQVVHQEIERLLPTWIDVAEESKTNHEARRVSNYIYECLMVLVETHSLCAELCPQMTRRAVLELYSNLLMNVLTELREIDNLSRYGTLQNITDLEFMRWALSQFPETTATCQHIFDAIRRASSDTDIWSHPEGPRGLVLSVLDEAVRQSHFAFYCFKSFGQK